VSLRNATVCEVLETLDDCQKLKVKYCCENKQIKTVEALNYLQLGAPCTPGQQAIINTTGIDLNLGTGGLAFVVPCEPCCTTDSQPGHIIKLRYTPLQRAYLTVEEQGSPYHQILKDATSIDGLPVVCCELHSQVPLVAAAIKRDRPEAKIVYCMTDQAALPLALSDLMRQCRDAGLIDTTITCGQAFGGDFETINLYSALLAAKYVCQAAVVIVSIGPGTPGSATKFGHGGVAQGQACNAVTALQGHPIAVLRISFADQRQRHQVVSHHSITALNQIALGHLTVAVPSDLSQAQVDAINSQLIQYNLASKHHFLICDPQSDTIDLRAVKVTTMGRDQSQDPAFFSAAYAAGVLAARYVQ
jgi:hypothetical protein